MRILAYQSDQDRIFFVLPLLIKPNARPGPVPSVLQITTQSQTWSHSRKQTMSLRVRAGCLGGHSDTPPLSRSTRQSLIQFGTFPNLVVLHGPTLLAQAPRLCDPEQINHPRVVIDLLCSISIAPASVRVPLSLAQSVALSGYGLATLVLRTFKQVHARHLGI